MSITLTRTRDVQRRIMLAALFLGTASTVGLLFRESWESSPWALTISSLIVTAVGMAMMVVAARTVEKRRLRTASLIAFALALIAYLLALSLFWVDVLDLFGSEGQTRTLTLLYSFFLAMGPAIGLVRLVHYPSRRIAGIAGVALSGIALLAMVVGAMVGGTSTQEMHLWLSGLWLEIYTLVLVANLVGVRSLVRPSFRWIGVIATAAGYGLALWVLIKVNDENWPRSLTWATVVAVFCGVANVSLRAPLRRGWRWLRWATIGLAAVSGSLLCYQVGHQFNNEWFGGIMLAACIGAIAGALAMYVLKRMNRKPPRAIATLKNFESLTIECPMCQSRQAIATGESACRECGLQFSLQLFEPRCSACGYLLYRIKSDRCPECGAPVLSSQPLTA